MDFRQLKYFTMVAEAKSFTRAAELSELAQPALSNQMLKLEEELQEQLFLRHSRGIELTDAGRRLLSHARTILHQVDVAVEDVRGARDEPEGLVRVGMPRSMGEILAVKLLQEARRRAPAMSVRIVEHFSESLYALLLERELDIALTFYSTENSVRVIAELISLQRLSLISPVNSDLSAADQIALSSAIELPLILGSPPHVVRKLLTAAAMENGTLPNVVHEIQFPADDVEHGGRRPRTHRPSGDARRQGRARRAGRSPHNCQSRSDPQTSSGAAGAERTDACAASFAIC